MCSSTLHSLLGIMQYMIMKSSNSCSRRCIGKPFWTRPQTRSERHETGGKKWQTDVWKERTLLGSPQWKIIIDIFFSFSFSIVYTIIVLPQFLLFFFCKRLSFSVSKWLGNLTLCHCLCVCNLIMIRTLLKSYGTLVSKDKLAGVKFS